MDLFMIVLLILLYLFIGCLIDYLLSGNPGKDIWIPMIFWPFMLLMVGVMLVFDMMRVVVERTVIFIEDLLNGEE